MSFATLLTRSFDSWPELERPVRLSSVMNAVFLGYLAMHAFGLFRPGIFKPRNPYSIPKSLLGTSDSNSKI